MTELQKRLLAIQSELKAPKNQYNSFGKYNYRNAEDILEAVKPLCKAYECLLTISDSIEVHGNRVFVVACVTLSHGEESIYTTAYARESENKKGMDDAQITGSASSYARKYALNGLFCIDDTKDADYTASDNQPKVTEIYKQWRDKITTCDNLETLESYRPSLNDVKSKITTQELQALSDLFNQKKSSLGGQ